MCDWFFFFGINFMMFMFGEFFMGFLDFFRGSFLGLYFYGYLGYGLGLGLILFVFVWRFLVVYFLVVLCNNIGCLCNRFLVVMNEFFEMYKSFFFLLDFWRFWYFKYLGKFCCEM